MCTCLLQCVHIHVRIVGNCLTNRRPTSTSLLFFHANGTGSENQQQGGTGRCRDASGPFGTQRRQPLSASVNSPACLPFLWTARKKSLVMSFAAFMFQLVMYTHKHTLDVHKHIHVDYSSYSSRVVLLERHMVQPRLSELHVAGNRQKRSDNREFGLSRVLVNIRIYAQTVR